MKLLVVGEKKCPDFYSEWETIFNKYNVEISFTSIGNIAESIVAFVPDILVLTMFPDLKNIEKVNGVVGNVKNNILIFHVIDNMEDIRKDRSSYINKLDGIITLPLDEKSVNVLIFNVNKAIKQATQKDQLISEIKKYREQKLRLIKIGTALSSQSDLKELLGMILRESCKLVTADAGSIYIKDVKGNDGEIYSEKANRIVFKVAQNNSIQLKEKTKEFAIDIGPGTIAGYVAFTNEVLNIDDVYDLPKDAPYSFGSDFDKRLGYRTKSMLTVPMKNKNKEIVGVLQLINRKVNFSDKIQNENDTKKIISFAPNDEELILSLASQAAVAIEKAQLYFNIENLFKGFVESSVAAIDARDEVTSGHSKRVRSYAIKMAEVINSKDSGPFKDIFFDKKAMKVFEYAALLHDIGKIGVKESVLAKPTRLTKENMEVIEYRWRFSYLLETSMADREHFKKEMEEDLEFIKKLNTSVFLDDKGYERLKKIKSKKYKAPDGSEKELITDNEFKHLSIRKGNLTEEERNMINYHAESTRQILSRMPWTGDLEGVTEIACHHHEKLDGTGYPDGLKGDEISLQSKILAVIDIYEALVARDRPYKPPMPVDKALQILKYEVKDNHLDSDVLDVFIDDKVYEMFV